MKTTVSEKDPCTRSIAVEVDEEQVQKKIEELLGKYKKSVQVPGFRPGKVPREIIEKRFGKGVRDEAIEDVVSDSFKEVCAKENLRPINRPVITSLKADEGAPLSYQADVEIDPPLELSVYKDLGVTIEKKTVADKDVDTVVEELRDRLATLTTVQRPLRAGDFALLEYRKVVIGGVEKKDAENPKYPVEIRKGAPDDFQQQLIGCAAGEEKTVTFTFKSDYSVKDLAGKDASFTIFVKEVKEKNLPTADDAFAKEVNPEAATMVDLREQLKKELEQENARAALGKAHTEAIAAIVAKNPIHIPASRLQSFLSLSYDNFKNQYNNTTISFEEFCEKNREPAITELKRYKILDWVAAKENIKASTEEVDAEIRRLAAMRGASFDETKAALRKNGAIINIRDDLRERKALNFLVNHTGD